MYANLDRLTSTDSTDSAGDQATVVLRRAILSGQFRPGERLAARTVCEAAGVSLMPVREAIRRVAGEGLIELTSNSATRVAALEPARLRGIFELRRKIEPELAAAASTLLEATTLNELEKQLLQLSYAEEPEGEHYEKCHAIHLALLRPAAGSLELRMVDELGRATEHYLRSAGHARYQRHCASTVEGSLHRMIIELRARDPHTAHAAALRYIQDSEQLATTINTS